jgi:hypothetical protein
LSKGTKFGQIPVMVNICSKQSKIKMAAPVLSNMQKELLRLYSTEIPYEQLEEIKFLLSRYFAEKATSEMDRLWDENNWNDQTMKQWANEHNRHQNSH